MDENIDQSAQEVGITDPQPHPGEVEQQRQYDNETAGPDGPDADGAPAEPDDEEIEHEGETFRIPKKLKPLLLMQRDYTQKTQEAAEVRRAAEAERTELAQSRQAHVEAVERQQANLQIHAQVAAIDHRLQEYQNVNWQQAFADSPGLAQQHWVAFQQLKEQRGDAVQHLTQQEAIARQASERDRANRMQKAHQVLSAEIKGWSPELQTKLFEYGRSIGIDQERLKQVDDPLPVRLLHKAYLYDQLVTKASTKPKPVTPAAPIATVKSGSGAATNPDSMSMEQWAEWDRKRQAKRRNT